MVMRITGNSSRPHVLDAVINDCICRSIRTDRRGSARVVVYESRDYPEPRCERRAVLGGFRVLSNKLLPRGTRDRQAARTPAPTSATGHEPGVARLATMLALFRMHQSKPPVNLNLGLSTVRECSDAAHACSALTRRPARSQRRGMRSTIWNGPVVMKPAKAAVAWRGRLAALGRKVGLTDRRLAAIDQTRGQIAGKIDAFE